ncbi:MULTISPECIES: GAF domain-containing protein [Aquitalea]|uniref:Putative methionine-R-sulfoxide reductase with GAF domain n=1 Tax=Aquitalea magnusonii TaxID=332411 RepID=A0A318JIY8_9NEIS|nr:MULTISPECIES: GAF domain-containing protein [Aquitalea]PXX49056.1 putative methionine-R-sulfoxide reductase with GAF domain [Aquitalea magnusonii]
MIPNRQLNDYVREQGLKLDRTELQIAVMTLQAVLDVDKSPLQRDLFRYPVPKLSEDGSCSLIEELADEPYDLAPWFGGESEPARSLLTNLHALLDSVNHKIGADWLGIYRRAGEGKDARLVKLAYQGLPSRAEFPLTEAFAETSNNSRVGLTGWGVLIEDVAVWRAEGGGYYECDPKVKSEVCLPVVDEHDRVLGILDAEASQTGFFDESRLVWLAALAIVLAAPFAAMTPLEKA